MFQSFLDHPVHLSSTTIAGSDSVDVYLNDGLEIAARRGAEGEHPELGGVPPQLPDHLAVGVVTQRL